MRRRFVEGITWGAALVAFLGAGSPEKIMVRPDRWFPASYEEVWDTVLLVLKQEGWNVVREEKGKGILHTDFYEFPSGRFGPNVATDPPRLSWDYGTFHRVQLAQGRCKLKVSVRPSGKGTRVSLAAVIEELTFHRRHREPFWAPRESNGAIELQILDRVEKALGEPHPEREEGSPADP